MAKAPEAPVVRFELQHADGSIWRLTGAAAAEHVRRIGTICEIASRHATFDYDEPPWEITKAPESAGEAA
jgi:hypothetical protein